MSDNATYIAIVLIVVCGLVFFQRGCNEWTTVIQENQTERTKIEGVQE